jgi:hypothetical protein
MDKIEKYINSIYRDTDDKSNETLDLKQEMTIHLKQAVKELQDNGVSEEESIRIAIERFGEGFQIRGELSQVVKFQKFFAKSVLIASTLFIILSVFMFMTSHYVLNEFNRHYAIMESQVNLAENIFIKDGIRGLDKYLKDSFRDKNNQLTYAAIRILPSDFNDSKNTELFPGKVKYIYPEKVNDEYFKNRCGHVFEVSNQKYYIETGIMPASITDYSGTYRGMAFLFCAICWVLWIIWSIINVNRLGGLNTSWVIILILFSIVGYLLFLSMRFLNRNKAV